MRKKILSLCLIAVLALTVMIGGTVAYFTDTEKASNVMTAGDVKINLEEYMYDEDGNKVAFASESALPLYPMTDEQGVAMKGNKIVDVYNTSNDAVYIRTIVAFEDFPATATAETPVHYRAFENNNYASQGIYGVDWQNAYECEVTINEVVYEIFVFNTVDGAAIPPGERVQSLQAVWLDKGLTNEDVIAELGEDRELNVLVLAQGVQTANFESHEEAFAAAFPLSEDNIVKWFEEAENAVINDMNQ